MNFEFHGKVVAIAGSAIGYGRAMAKAFARAGARVHGCDVAEPEDDDDGLAIPTDRVDLLNPQAPEDWIRSVEARAGQALDILVCNAGGVAGQDGRQLEDVSDADWDRVIGINLHATFRLCRATAPTMKAAGRGAIVTITSGAAFQPSLTGIQAYCSAKHGVLGLTRQLARELGPYGVRVNSVAPGFLETGPATRRQWAAFGPRKQREIVEGISLKRLGTAEEVADVVMFFASDRSTFVNGQVLAVDGGR